MTDLSGFAVTPKWPATYPERLQLCSLPTPNEAKVSLMLGEIRLPYEAQFVERPARSRGLAAPQHG